MRFAIVTSFIGPSNFRGPRVSAKSARGRVVVSWDDALDVTPNHRAAMEALCRKLDPSGESMDPAAYVPGEMPDGSIVWVRP